MLDTTSNATKIDCNPGHLYPPFASKMAAVLAEATRESAGKFPGFRCWTLFEGYRSQTRQTALYAKGRTTPGDIVTHMTKPLFHGIGLAADCVWLDDTGRPRWDGDDAMWQILGHCARAQGLEWGGDWPGDKHDGPHIQPRLTQRLLWTMPARAFIKKQGLSLP